MNNEEKILALLEKQDARFERIESQLAAQGEQLAAQGEQLAAQGKQLEKLTADMADVRATLDDHSDRLRMIESAQENRIIPSLQLLAEGHTGLLETLAHKDSIEELRDAMAEWEVANQAAFAEMWSRVSQLEQLE